MPDFTVSIAGIPIGISALYPSTRAFLEEYLTQKTPLFSVEVAEEDIEFEQEQSAVQNKREGIPVQRYGARYLETLAVLRKIADRAFDYGVVLFHGSVVAVDGRAYLFTAPSGTGKTTHSKLWLERFPNAYILNGDKPFLKEENGRILAYGTPWRGKEQFGRNEMLPLEAICLLERGQKNSIVKIGLDEALETMLRQIHLPNTPDSMLKAVSMCDKIGKSVRLYRLKCNTDPEAAAASGNEMLIKK